MSRDALVAALLLVAGAALSTGGFLVSRVVGAFVLGGWAAGCALLLAFGSSDVEVTEEDTDGEVRFHVKAS